MVTRNVPLVELDKFLADDNNRLHVHAGMSGPEIGRAISEAVAWGAVFTQQNGENQRIVVDTKPDNWDEFKAFMQPMLNGAGILMVPDHDAPPKGEPDPEDFHIVGPNLEAILTGIARDLIEVPPPIPFPSGAVYPEQIEDIHNLSDMKDRYPKIIF